MALYRQIAGSNVGALSISPTGSTSLSSYTFHPVDAEQAIADYYAQVAKKYDYVMSKSASDLLNQDGIYVYSDGSLFQWIDKSTGLSTAWLPIQDIQMVENDRGTAGALLMHMNEPTIAANTAGYEGGGSADFGSSQVTDPIPEVQAVQAVYSEPSSPATTTETTQKIITDTVPTGTTAAVTATTNNVASAPSNVDWPVVLTLGSLVFFMIRGEPLFGNNRKLIFIGGLGALYYQLSKK